MSDDVKEFWDELEQVYVENGTDTPLHTLLALRVFETKVRENICETLGVDAAELDGALAELESVTDKVGPRSAETIQRVADITADKATGRQFDKEE